MPAFGQRLEAVVHGVEAFDDGHRFRLAYLRKQWDTHVHNGNTFVLGVVRERYLRPGTENMGSPDFTDLDRVYDANIASAASTTTRQRYFSGACRRNDRDRDGGGNNRDNFRNARHPRREAAAPRATVTKDVTRD
eukprot:jgi/Tetstr1/438848/TSEL_027357.t1